MYVGHELRIKTIKSKVSRPQQESISYLIDGNLDYEENLYNSAKSRFNIISSRGWKTYVTDDGEEVKFQQDEKWVDFLKSPEGAEVRKELFQKMLIMAFPEGFAPLKNVEVDVHKWPDMVGIEERYAQQGQESEVEVTQSETEIDSAIDKL